MRLSSFPAAMLLKISIAPASGLLIARLTKNASSAPNRSAAATMVVISLREPAYTVSERADCARPPATFKPMSSCKVASAATKVRLACASNCSASPDLPCSTRVAARPNSSRYCCHSRVKRSHRARSSGLLIRRT